MWLLHGRARLQSGSLALGPTLFPLQLQVPVRPSSDPGKKGCSPFHRGDTEARPPGVFLPHLHCMQWVGPGMARTEKGCENRQPEWGGTASRGPGLASWRRQHVSWGHEHLALRGCPLTPLLTRHIPVVPAPPTSSGPGERGRLEKGALCGAVELCLGSRTCPPGGRGRGRPWQALPRGSAPPSASPALPGLPGLRDRPAAPGWESECWPPVPT